MLFGIARNPCGNINCVNYQFSCVDLPINIMTSHLQISVKIVASKMNIMPAFLLSLYLIITYYIIFVSPRITTCSACRNLGITAAQLRTPLKDPRTSQHCHKDLRGAINLANIMPSDASLSDSKFEYFFQSGNIVKYLLKQWQQTPWICLRSFLIKS